MKTQVKTSKPASAKPAVKASAKPASKPAVKASPKVSAKPASLYAFDFTPAGRMLRAYFIAFITVQTGKLEAGKEFRLWPAANIRGHLDTKKVERKGIGYALTSAGVNYFTDPQQMADKDMLAQMEHAVRTGEKPACYKHNMQAIG